jgi:hypothetical protein
MSRPSASLPCVQACLSLFPAQASLGPASAIMTTSPFAKDEGSQAGALKPGMRPGIRH